MNCFFFNINICMKNAKMKEKEGSQKSEERDMGGGGRREGAENKRKTCVKKQKRK
jgi:hypothetical protein